MHLTKREHRPFLLFISFVAIIRLLVAPYLGLGVDEAHYVLYAHHLDWSYFDHPPLVGWLQYVFTSIFGDNEFGARVGAITIGFFTSYFLYLLLYSLQKDAHKAFISILALHSLLMFNALFLMLMPDTLLFLLILPIIFATVSLGKEQSIKHWLYLGFLLGVAGLSKYTAILFLFPIISYFLIKKQYSIFRDSKIFLAILLALFIVSPVIYWNIQNHWISFTYQSEHVIGNAHINFFNFFQSILAQFIAYNPFLFILAFYGLYRAFTSKNDTLLLSALFGLILFSFFTYSSLYKTALPHWSAIFYLLFIPLGVYFLYDKSQKWKKYIQFSLFFGILFSLALYIEIATKIIPLPDKKTLQLDIYGFKKVMKRANKYIKNPQTEALAVMNWTLASRTLFYNKEYNSQVYLLDEREDQFDLWQQGSPLGKNIIIINVKTFNKDINKYLKCDNVKILDSFNIVQLQQEEDSIQIIKCTNYKGLQ